MMVGPLPFLLRWLMSFSACFLAIEAASPLRCIVSTSVSGKAAQAKCTKRMRDTVVLINLRGHFPSRLRAGNNEMALDTAVVTCWLLRARSRLSGHGGRERANQKQPSDVASNATQIQP